MLYIGHEQGYDALDRMLKAYQAGGYTRLVPFGNGETVLMDSKQAPGYVPGVPGKAETGVEYVPNGDGVYLDIFYISKEKADKRAIAEAVRAKKCGMDSRHIVGSLVSIRRLADGNIQLMFIAANRDHIEGGVRTDKVAVRSVSITNDPAKKGGLIVALGLGQGIGVDMGLLKKMADDEENLEKASKTLSGYVASARQGIPNQPVTPPVEIPAQQVSNPEEAK